MSKFASKAVGIALLGLTLPCAQAAKAQDVGSLWHAIANHVTEKAEQKANDTIDQRVDTHADSAQPGKHPMWQVDSGFDFTPAPVVLQQDNFADVTNGAMPHDWKTNGSGQVVSVRDFPGKWLDLQADSTFKLTYHRSLPERFTIQFDLLPLAETADDLASMDFGFASDNLSAVHLTSSTSSDGLINVINVNFANSGGIFARSAATDFSASPDFKPQYYVNRVLHVSIAVDGKRERVYLDHTKILDSKTFDDNPSRYFYVSGASSYDHHARMLLGNFRAATYDSTPVAGSPTASVGSSLAPPLVKTPPGQRRPTLDVATADGSHFDLAAHRGQWVLVNYWATWCAPCTTSLRVLSGYANAHANVAVIGIAGALLQPQRSDVAVWGKAHPLHFPLAWVDATQANSLVGDLRAIPLTWLIAPDGTLVRSFYGQFDLAQLDHIMQAAGYPGTSPHAS